MGADKSLARPGRKQATATENFDVHISYLLCTCFWWGSLRERDHWGDPDVDGRIILRGIFRKWEGVVGTGWSGLRIETGGGHL
jgi:hypothetical protein